MSMNWIELEDLNYRQVPIYDMTWEKTLPLHYFHVAIAKFGGPIARVLKPKSLVKSDSSTLSSAKYLTIDSASGRSYSKIQWDYEKPLVGLGWTSDETLVVVYKSGSLDFFNIWGDRVTPPLDNVFSPRSVEILKFQVLENTLVLFANDGCFYTIRGVPQCNSFTPELFFRMNPNSMGFDMQLIIGLAEGGIKLVSDSQKEGASFSKVPFSTDDNMTVSHIAISGNSTMFAFLLDSGVVQVVPSDLSKLLGRQAIPKKGVEQVVWCGSDAVCLVYSSFLAILGPNSCAQVDYTTQTNGAACISEVDGLRIITTEKHELLEKVDKSVEAIFSIGMFTPASLLKTAYELYLNQNSNSGDSIRTLQQEDQLLEAVETCMTAACCEFSTENQESLLKTAAFGKTFLPIKSYDSNKFVETVKNLRVLNNVRKEDVARPLTYKQLNVMRHNGELLVRRLLDSHHHYLALQISKLWKLREEQIYVHWACAKLIDQQYSDPEMCEIICSKLSNCKGISYTEITRKALDSGRRELAIRLLENEPIIARRVPLLLYMSEMNLALDKAIESMNPNLIYLVVMKVHEEEKEAREDSNYVPGTSVNIETVLRKPVSREMLLTYAKQMDEKLLMSANQMLKRNLEMGNVYLEKALTVSELSAKLKSLKSAETVYQLHTQDPFYCSVMRDQQLLIEKQKKAGKETSVLSITGASVSVCDTIYQLLLERHQQAAESIAKSFQVPEKKMWYIKLRVWSQKDEWTEFEATLNGKKPPPIGFKPFADMAAKKGNYEMAEKCILKVNEPDYQVTMLMFLGKFMSAAQVAVRAKNLDILPEIAKQCTDPEVRGFIDNALSGRTR